MTDATQPAPVGRPGTLDRLQAALEELTGALTAAFRDVGLVAGPKLTKSGKLAARILAALAVAATPLRGKQLARLVGCKADSHFREVVAQLLREGRVVKAKAGYATATPPS